MQSPFPSPLYLKTLAGICSIHPATSILWLPWVWLTHSATKWFCIWCFLLWDFLLSGILTELILLLLLKITFVKKLFLVHYQFILLRFYLLFNVTSIYQALTICDKEHIWVSALHRAVIARKEVTEGTPTIQRCHPISYCIGNRRPVHSVVFCSCWNQQRERLGSPFFLRFSLLAPVSLPPPLGSSKEKHTERCCKDLVHQIYWAHS